MFLVCCLFLFPRPQPRPPLCLLLLFPLPLDTVLVAVVVAAEEGALSGSMMEVAGAPFMVLIVVQSLRSWGSCYRGTVTGLYCDPASPDLGDGASVLLKASWV